jgi:hypothetical protein
MNFLFFPALISYLFEIKKTQMFRRDIVILAGLFFRDSVPCLSFYQKKSQKLVCSIVLENLVWNFRWHNHGKHGRTCLLTMSRAHTARNVELHGLALFRATCVQSQKRCVTWCHCKLTSWYPHHANLQILSDNVLYMVSPQTHYFTM